MVWICLEEFVCVCVCVCGGGGGGGGDDLDSFGCHN